MLSFVLRLITFFWLLPQNVSREKAVSSVLADIHGHLYCIINMWGWIYGGNKTLNQLSQFMSLKQELIYHTLFRWTSNPPKISFIFLTLLTLLLIITLDQQIDDIVYWNSRHIKETWTGLHWTKNYVIIIDKKGNFPHLVLLVKSDHSAAKKPKECRPRSKWLWTWLNPHFTWQWDRNQHIYRFTSELRYRLKTKIIDFTTSCCLKASFFHREYSTANACGVTTPP